MRLPEDLIGPETWNNSKLLPPDVKEALIKRHVDTMNDDKVWLDFISTSQMDLSKMTKQQFETSFWSRLDARHREQAAAHYQNALEAAANPKAAAAFQGVISDSQMILRGAQAIGDGGISSTDTLHDIEGKDKKVQAYRAFEDEVQSKIGAYYHATGKNADDQVKQGIIDDIVRNKTRTAVVRKALFGVDSLWPDSTKRISQLSDAEILEAAPTDMVPQAFVNNCVNLLRSQGNTLDLSRESDKMRVGRAYIAALRGKNELLKQILGVK